MYDNLLASEKEAFDKLQKSFDAARENYLKEAAKYKYFKNAQSLASPPVRRAAYSDRTAWVMASMSQLAYEPFEKDEASLGLFISKLDSGNFKLVSIFSREGTQGFLAHNNIYAVLAFRGTEKDWSDVQTDIRTKRVRTTEGGIHAGFKAAYDLVENQIKEQLNNDEVRKLPLYITGHSLGGALATVATQDLELSGLKDQIAACYTFGSPRVGNADFDRNIKSPFYRLVNFIDVVTFVPLLTMGFTHVGDVRYLDRGEPDQVRRYRPLSQRFFFFLSLFGLLVPAAKAHGIVNYVAKLQRIALDNNAALKESMK